MKKFSMLLATVLLLSACATADKGNYSVKQLATVENPSTYMSLDEKIGQILMVRSDSVTNEQISEKKPGAIIMFESDFSGLSKKEVTDKIEQYKSLSDIPPIIAVDEEGGDVVRVSSNPNLAPEKYKSPQEYFRLGGMDLIKENAAEKSKLLLDLGITMNLAPVADVSTDPSHFIYNRTFGQDYSKTAEYIKEVVSVMKENNMISCLKHFPGYGGNIDTHTDVAIDNRPLGQLESEDFLPFISGIEAGADCIMVSHNVINDVDSSLPASISPAVHNIIRDNLGFDGIIITDDMAMDAVNHYNEPYKKAVLAGNDLIIVTDFDEAYNEILAGVNDGSIPVDMINNAVDRIIKTKVNHKILESNAKTKISF